MQSSVDIVILTALPEEYQAIGAHLTDLHPPLGTETTPNLYAWQLGVVPRAGKDGTYRVAVGMTGRAGTNESALATMDAIQRWNPRYVFFVGIAGGLSSVQKGDVVLADIIYGYEYGKVEALFQPRSNWTYKTDLALLNGANAYALQKQWHDFVRATPPTECTPNFITGEIASGDKVVDDPTNAFFAQVLKTWPKVKAVEMEGAGVGSAIEQSHALGKEVGFTMIRAISDVPRPARGEEVRGTQERDAWKRYAAATSAAFVVGFVASNFFPVSPKDNRSQPVSSTASRAEIQVQSQSAPSVVFISHRKQDVALAERLAVEIRQAGFQVWFDEWNIHIGDSIVERINTSLENTRYLIVCYSDAGVLSRWMSREWMSALARQMDGCGVRVLPVRLSGGAPPAILADIKYADLVQDWARGVADLLRAMR
jgi:nucleoside phosphorylase